MALPRIEERTLYAPIIKHLESLGFEAIGNVTVTAKEPDILFRYSAISFVIEVKVGRPEILGLKAVAQASDYGRRLGTQNIIILIYPDSIRNEPITDYGIVDHIALRTKISVITLTEPWTESLEIEPASMFQQLKTIIDENKSNIDFSTTVKLIGRYASDLNSVVYQIKTDELISEVVNKLELFTSIGDIKDKEAAKRQVTNLASFLLFNQLLFYHIYKRRVKKSNIPELEEIKSLKDIQLYFSKITKIDYKSIYGIDLLKHIPERKEIIEILNDVIKAIKLLRAEYITHDLAGRFFHDLIPFEVRKVLAAFYTHPTAADLLAGLAIEKYDATIIDPACGSGTLLVASYNRKMELYQQAFGTSNVDEAHKMFIESDLTGIDIMPFAAHISSINLSMQNIEEQTNIVRIATQDSLELVEVLDTKTFKGGKFRIDPYTESFQLKLFDEENAKTKRKRGSVSTEGKGSTFYLKPVDLVIMNPPFSDREKMPQEMRDNLNENRLSGICGNQVNLWGYFIALADKLLKPNGRIAAVIPINIARGKATEQIRHYLLSNYSIEYMIKETVDTAFSESASFKDILLIAKKRKPSSKDLVSIVFLKTSFKAYRSKDVKIRILDRIKNISNSKKFLETEEFQLARVSESDLSESEAGFMNILRGNDLKVRYILANFINVVTSASGKRLRNLAFEEMLEGFHASPAGLSEIVFIANPKIRPKSPRNTIMLIDGESNESVTALALPTDSRLNVPRKTVRNAMKTLTSVSRIDITNYHDYIICDKFDGFTEILALSKWKGEFDWEEVRRKMDERATHIALQHRIRVNSDNTSLIAVYSDTPFYTTHAFNIFKIDKTEAKIQSLFLNSIIGLVQLSSLSKETTEGYLEFMQSDLTSVKVINLPQLSEPDKEKLLRLFDELRNMEFPSIVSQLSNPFEGRVKLDTIILETIGCGNLITSLNEIYKAYLNEIFENERPMK